MPHDVYSKIGSEDFTSLKMDCIEDFNAESMSQMLGALLNSDAIPQEGLQELILNQWCYG